MTLDNSHSASSNAGVLLLHFTHVVGLGLLLLEPSPALIFCNPKAGGLAASGLYSDCGQLALKSSITVLGRAVKGILRDVLKVRPAFGRAERGPLHPSEELASGRWPCGIGVNSAPQDLLLSSGPQKSQFQSPVAQLE